MATTLPVLASSGNIPAVREGGLSHYFQGIKQFPILSVEEEYMLARRFREYGDRSAAHRLVTSHLRLAAKIAVGYRHYGLPLADLISEGNVGLMQAVKKFDPEKGVRLSTYAIWWIKAALNQFVLNSWSLVKMGTIAAQKKLFFNLRKMKARLGHYSDKDLSNEDVARIADDLDVSQKEVREMNVRISRDSSLNMPVMEGEALERQDMLSDARPNQEAVLAETQEHDYRAALLQKGLSDLSEREQDIIVSRRLTDSPVTLELLGERYGISRERVRQIENRAFEKLTQSVLAAASD